MCVGGLMTDDHASAEPQCEHEHSTVDTDDQKQGSGHKVEKILRTLLKGWRALAFLLIFLTVGHYAFHYKALSDPGLESKQFADNAPQEIDFFVSNPLASIDVYAEIQPANSEPSSPAAPQMEDINIIVHAPPKAGRVTVLVLTREPTFGPFGPDYSRLENVPLTVTTVPLSEQQTIDGYFATKISSDLAEWADGVGSYLIRTVEQTNATLYGHLPAIGTTDQWVKDSDPADPPVLAESYKDKPDRIRDVVLLPFTEPEYANQPSYNTPFGGPGELFSTPARLSITETEKGLAPQIANQQINYMTPTGQASGPDYTWQGTTQLEPVFQTTDDNALQSESNYAFFQVSCSE